jgi:hypothetical protein
LARVAKSLSNLVELVGFGTDDLIVAKDGVCQFSSVWRALPRRSRSKTFQSTCKIQVCRESCLYSFSGFASHGAPAPWDVTLGRMASAKKQTLIVVDVTLQRVRVAVPRGLTVAQAIRAGILLGGIEFVAREDLRVAARDQLDELGVEGRLISPRGALPERLRIAAPGPLKSSGPLFVQRFAI